MARRPRLLLTRPETASRRFLATCEDLAGRPLDAVVSPVMAIRSTEARLPARTHALILTSENGARRALELAPGPVPAWCVGPRTAAVARAGGLRAVEAGPDSDALVASILSARPPRLLVHLRGEHARGDIAARLRAGGLEATDVVAYRQEARPPTPQGRAALDGTNPIVAPLFSPRSADLLAGWSPRAPLHVVALSPAVADAARRLSPRTMVVAAGTDADAMAAQTVAALERVGGSPP